MFLESPNPEEHLVNMVIKPLDYKKIVYVSLFRLNFGFLMCFFRLCQNSDVMELRHSDSATQEIYDIGG